MPGVDLRSAGMAGGLEIGYSGWVVVEAEQDPHKANPLEMARIGHQALSEAFGDAGFRITG
jgi:inosose dehydratase